MLHLRLVPTRSSLSLEPGVTIQGRPSLSTSLSLPSVIFMNTAMKAGLTNSQANYTNLRAAFFHSTPVLDRKRRTQWDSRFSNYTKRSRKPHGKQTLLRNVSAYAEHLFQSFESDFDQDGPSSSRGPSWFKKQYGTKGSRRDRTGYYEPPTRGRRGSFFCEDDFDVETIFRSAFGGNKHYFWSFINEENSQWRSSSGYSNNYKNSWNWRGRFEDEYDSETDNSSESDLASHRLALGLSSSGPLKLEEVKTAYRACALKWHPDRHQGSSKVVAEEKFKLCSSAYQSLCDKLAVS